MSQSRIVSLGFAAVALFCSAPAFAQATRTWVSGVGDDVNPCSRTAPCKTFAGAISKTAAGGEIDALDPGTFGAVTITKAITIDGGEVGGVLVSGTNAIVIAAGTGDVVTIRRVNLNGIGTGLSGIKVTSAGAVHVEKCTIFGFKTRGIDFSPTNNAALFVRESILRNNGDSSSATNANIYINAAAAGVTVTAAIEKSTLAGGQSGLDVAGSPGTLAKVTVHDSMIVGSATIGAHAEASAEINLERDIVGYHLTGAQTDGSGLIRLSNVMVPHNTTAVSGSNINSFGNNELNAGNSTIGSISTTLGRQ
jgi:hypothetical protein